LYTGESQTHLFSVYYDRLAIEYFGIKLFTIKVGCTIFFACHCNIFPLNKKGFKHIENIHRTKLSIACKSDGTKGAIYVKDIEVKVFDNDIEKAMRILKKKIQNDGLFKRLKLKKSYEKPSEFRRRKQREALRRERIAAARARRKR
jgi:small subunit ribosomal protein S21